MTMNTILLTCLLVIFLEISTIIAQEDAPNNLVLYADISLANRNESYQKIRNVAIKTFEFKYDKIAGRRQMGVLAVDAYRYFPESVEVVAQHSIPGKEKNSFITLNNFPIVDKSVIFMHGLVALQELLSRYENQLKQLARLEEIQQNHENMFQLIESQINASVSDSVLEQRKLLEMEILVRENRQLLELKAKESEKDLIEEQLKNEKEMLEYEELLAKSRLELQEQLARESMNAAVQLEKELALQRETLRITNADRLTALRGKQVEDLTARKTEFEIDKIKAELEAKALQERANEDIAIRKLQMQSKLDTQQMVEGVKVISEQLSNLVQQFLSRPKQIASVFGAIAAVLFAYNLFCQFILVLRTMVQSRLGRPSLVRETSFSWSFLPDFVYRALDSLGLLFSHIIGRKSERINKDQLDAIASHFKNVILEAEAKERILLLAQATRNTKRSGAPYRHVLLHGPPGTGKTMIARKLAQCSNMDYAIMSGGDVGPLGEQAVDQLNELFHWASRSRRGLLLFIDEAEAFLSTRKGANSASSTGGGSSGDDEAFVRHALNALLYQTGTQSKSLMLVLATNRPGDLDPAILDRIDLSMFVGLPATIERIALAKLYLHIHVSEPAQQHNSNFGTRMGWNKACTVEDECSTDNVIAAIAERTDGFSGREIAKLFIAAHYALLLTDSKTLSATLLKETVEQKVVEHLAKKGFVNLTKKGL